MLLQKVTVTAPYLAEKFEVSRRTINRDIEDLCKAGISIVTKQGVNGTNCYGQLMEKLSVGSSDFMVGNQSVLIDLSSWYKDSLAPKIELIRTSIDKCRKLELRSASNA